MPEEAITEHERILLEIYELADEAGEEMQYDYPALAAVLDRKVMERLNKAIDLMEKITRRVTKAVGGSDRLVYIQWVVAGEEKKKDADVPTPP